jgi:hypothetical protein
MSAIFNEDLTAKADPRDLERLGWDFDTDIQPGDSVLFWPGSGGMCYTYIHHGIEGETQVCDMAGAIVDLEILHERGRLWLQ